MMQLVEANWPILVAALLIGLLAAWLILRATRKTTVMRDPGSGEPGDPAKRNQALIDTPPASTNAAFAAPDSAPDPVVAPGALAGAGIAASEAIPPQETAPEPEGVPIPVPGPDSKDDLTRIKGVGPKLAALLGDLGISSLAQIASWNDDEIDRIDEKLGRFQGRIRRDDWVKQAALLDAGDTAGYEKQFGRL